MEAQREYWAVSLKLSLRYHVRQGIYSLDRCRPWTARLIWVRGAMETVVEPQVRSVGYRTSGVYDLYLQFLLV